MDKGKEEKLYNAMSGFIGFMSRRYKLTDHWLMGEDDLAGESYLALARVMQKYGDKPLSELKTISKTSVRNAIKTMQAKTFGTGRVREINALSIDEPVAEDGEHLEAVIAGTSPDPANWYESVEWVVALLPKLNHLERRVVDALLCGTERVRMYLQLSSDRRSWLYRDPTITITPLIVARALCEDIEDIETAYDGIRVAVSEVL